MPSEFTYLGAGGLGVLVLVIIYLLRANTLDRRDYRVGIQSYRTRYEAAAERASRCEETVDAERTKRREAEEAMWKARRENGQIETLRQEVLHLRQIVMGSSSEEH